MRPGRGIRRPLVSLACAALTLTIISGCTPGGGPTDDGRGDGSLEADGLRGTLTVFAAASLTDAFGAIADDFEAAHPDVTVVLNLGGSSALAEGIVSGAPVDVFAAASAATMSTITDGGLSTETPQTFAGNTLEIAVPAGNPADITGLESFADPEAVIALCAPEVPCGAASTRLLAAAGVTPVADTLEQDVRAALTKVELGEVDAALVYATDVLAAGDAVEGIEAAGAADVVSAYPIVALTAAPNPDAAEAFVAFVLGDVGREALAAAGFLIP
ncbi:MAG: hypothetical protein RI885_564 [Actinomycetota bacterium]|jgi:molybdate transport system substrate-binding protein